MNLVTLPLATPAQLPPYVASRTLMAFAGFFSSAVTLATGEQRIMKATHPSARCAFRKLYPDVMVVQPRQDWDGYNDPGPLPDLGARPCPAPNACGSHRNRQHKKKEFVAGEPSSFGMDAARAHLGMRANVPRSAAFDRLPSAPTGICYPNARCTASVASPWMRSHAACVLRPRAVNCEKNGKLVRASSTSIRSFSALGRNLRSAAMRRTRTDNKRRRRSLRSCTLAPNSGSLAPAACKGPSASKPKLQKSQKIEMTSSNPACGSEPA